MTLIKQIFLSVFICVLPLSAAQEGDLVSEIDPLETEKALNALFRHGDQIIPESSSCYDRYADTETPTINNLLAMNLAYLYDGANAIRGACVENKCIIRITHAAGEDVFSTTIYFALKQGRMDATSLQCMITP